jgi:hypothetical protein
MSLSLLSPQPNFFHALSHPLSTKSITLIKVSRSNHQTFHLLTLVSSNPDAFVSNPPVQQMDSSLTPTRNSLTTQPLSHSSSSSYLPPNSANANANSLDKDNSKDSSTTSKRRCVSTACIACRKRKSKCDGQLPKCAACASVYLTECEYAPHTDHRRKGVYKKDISSLKTRNSALQTLLHAILTYDDHEVPDLVAQIRSSENLEDLAESLLNQRNRSLNNHDSPDSPIYNAEFPPDVPQFEAELSSRMGDLILDGSIKFVGGTSNLFWLPNVNEAKSDQTTGSSGRGHLILSQQEAVCSWSSVSKDKELIFHLINMYFCWHYAYFTTLSKHLFYRDFLQGRPTQYCSSLLVNVMLSLGCHFTARPQARAVPEDSATTGDHFFREAKRLLYENDEFANTKICTVQALSLMSVREAGCGREGTGWVYSGMSFRMAMDLGLNVDVPVPSPDSNLGDDDVDARRITFWGCFLFDKQVDSPLYFSTRLLTLSPDVGLIISADNRNYHLRASTPLSLKFSPRKKQRRGIRSPIPGLIMPILSQLGPGLSLCRSPSSRKFPPICSSPSTIRLSKISHLAGKTNSRN